VTVKDSWRHNALRGEWDRRCGWGNRKVTVPVDFLTKQLCDGKENDYVKEIDAGLYAGLEVGQVKGNLSH
jgi:hypothetical protein